MRKLGSEPSKTVILRIPGEWWHELDGMRGEKSMGGMIREVLGKFLYLRRKGLP